MEIIRIGINKFLRSFEILCKRFMPVSRNAPPKEIPESLLDDYTLKGKISIKYWYFDDTYSSSIPKMFTKKRIISLIKQAKNGTIQYYGDTGKWLLEALNKYDIRNKHTVVMGSVIPNCECICLGYGARHCTTIEYNKLVSLHPDLSVITPEEYDKNLIIFDIGFSISSFEHDGLGRYGDPLDPYADIKAMAKMKQMLKPNGLFFLSIPVGRDTLVWNGGRIYGRIRLPLMLEGWDLIDSFGFNDNLLDKDAFTKVGGWPQPVFVLRNR